MSPLKNYELIILRIRGKTVR
uniref:Uncharacterized protein n=1 Tax=Rhizophora mucronata TaxID=61149 RepID=A0A2P2IVD9_RHIMU